MCFAPQRRSLFRRLNFQKCYLACFVHFDLEMCFAPQRRTLFRHLDFQKCSDPGVVCAFWLGNLLRSNTACTFLTSQLPKMVWNSHFFTLLTSTDASGHNCVQLFISHLARWLRTRRFREPTFQPSRATNHRKNTVCRPFATFSRTCIFPPTLSLLFSSLLFASLLFSSLLFSDSSHLCFSICCRKFDF